MTNYSSVIRSLLLPMCAVFMFCSCSRENPKVLVFSKTDGFYHTSIPAGIEAIQKLGAEHGFGVDTTTHAGLFTEENLMNYAAVIFLNTTGDVLNHFQEADFERFIQAGGGFVGIHSAADTEYHWGWYGRLVGGYFLDHPPVQEGAVEVADKNHPATEFLPDRWLRTDEWYSYQDIYDGVNVLLTLDEESYEGGTPMGYHPIAWYHEYDGGRAFYTGGGHTDESYSEDLFLQHLLAGIRYAIGKNRLNYSKARTQRVQEENRFIKTSLVGGGLLTEPTEMTILPNLDVLIAQRRGEIMLYKHNDDTLKQAGFLDVYWQTDTPGVNAEEGIIGIQKDPRFEENRFVYIFHTPADTSVNRLSRFVFENDILQIDSETVILEFYSTRHICCHTGGSLAFDSDGLMYISTGDNATPFDQPGQPYVLNGYAPLDGRSGFEQYDARRTSGNSNDLRGKILRIKVNDDGSYEIPEGNLYPPGMEKTRPEIYVQGTRNSYRISIDLKNSYLYWGDVGPDAVADSFGVRGPRGYDEINQARKAGHFGWPFFVGDNYPYNEFNYATGTPGNDFDPARPVNRSPNNTGIEELPPAEPAFIWYPYGASEEFPLTRTGGRNAMAGPVYYSDLYPAETRLPEYYDGKLFTYDWIRDWIRVVTMQPNGDYDKMEPFMEDTGFYGMIDMELGPDGRLYILEYGKGWFSRNSDSGLARIDFNPGNRPPTVNALHTDKTSGLQPFEVVFKVDAADPDDDPLVYLWNTGDGIITETREPRLVYTFEQIGDYEVSVEVRDTGQLSAVSEPVEIYAGNTAPKVYIDITGNRSFYFPERPVEYSIRVVDEGPSGVSTTINPSNLFVSAEYVEDRGIAGEAPEGHLVVSDVMAGRSLAATLDCRACHHETRGSVGPTYTEISEHLRNESDAVTRMAGSIISGSSGSWGDVVMPAHPEMSAEDARKIAVWIRSLTIEAEEAESLPQSGSLRPTLEQESMENNVLVISASYTDEGGEQVKPLTGHAAIRLRNSRISVDAVHPHEGYQAMEFGGMKFLLTPDTQGSFSIPRVDLTGIAALEITAASQQPIRDGYSFEVRLGSPDGRQIGEGVLEPVSAPGSEEFVPYVFAIGLDPVRDGAFYDLFIISRPDNPQAPSAVALTGFRFVPE